MRFIWIFLVIAGLGISCGNNGDVSYTKATNALDAGREFIESCLKGEFERAALYMVKDEENNKDLKHLEDTYRKKPGSDRRQYKQASIMIDSVEPVTDSITIINYRNSFDRVARKLKVIRQQDEWRVDFKYTFSGNI